MRPLSYAGYRFPPEIIQHAIWLYLRFTLSFRDVEELLAERGIDVSHETVRRWVATFGPMIARRLRAMRPKPHTTWHLDEMFVSIGGKRMYLWRAVDAEGEVFDCLVQSRRDKQAALTNNIGPVIGVRYISCSAPVWEMPQKKRDKGEGFVTLSHCRWSLAAADQGN